MRVLWLSMTPAKYDSYSSNGGGWIEALQRVVEKVAQIELGIAFVSSKENEEYRIRRDGVTYYPIYIRRNIWQKWYDKYSYKSIDKIIIDKSLEIVGDYRPDVIQVFGSESCFGLIQSRIKVPVVIHWQGMWNAYLDYAKMLTKSKNIQEILFFLCKPRRFVNHFFLESHLSRERAAREETILNNVRFYMGRTIWDKALTELYSPNGHYYYCSEALRDAFVLSQHQWQCHSSEKYIFITTGLATRLKGYDIVLRTAQILKTRVNIDFEWRLIGPTPFQMRLFEKDTRIQCKNVNVVPLGNMTSSMVLEELLNADCYIHASYIDNSPNAICEAQYLGLPVISTRVGGCLSLFSDEYNPRLLVGPGNPYEMASAIRWLVASQERMCSAGKINYSIARKRHDDNLIARNLLSIYETIRENNDYDCSL